MIINNKFLNITLKKLIFVSTKFKSNLFFYTSTNFQLTVAATNYIFIWYFWTKLNKTMMTEKYVCHIILYILIHN